MAFHIERYRDVKTSEFELELITPLFLGGADSREVELRIPPVKAGLRFWWRALHPHLSSGDLKAEEAKIFGDAGDKYGKSRVVLKLGKSLVYDGVSKENPVPHKNVRPSPCFRAGEKFSLKIESNEKVVFDLFELMSVLGGLGKRSRRGFGSFTIIKIDNKSPDYISSIDRIHMLIKSIAGNKFEINNGSIIRSDRPDAEYPFIKCVEIGEKPVNNYREILKTIGQSSHDYKSDYTGFAKGPERLASPVYVSIIKGQNDSYRPIVTTLHTAFKENNQRHGPDKSQNFKRQILSGGSK